MPNPHKLKNAATSENLGQRLRKTVSSLEPPFSRSIEIFGTCSSSFVIASINGALSRTGLRALVSTACAVPRKGKILPKKKCAVPALGCCLGSTASLARARFARVARADRHYLNKLQLSTILRIWRVTLGDGELGSQARTSGVYILFVVGRTKAFHFCTWSNFCIAGLLGSSGVFLAGKRTAEAFWHGKNSVGRLLLVHP
jgi:hypothetical protein